MRLTVKSTQYENFNKNPKYVNILLEIEKNRDLPFITDQFILLGLIMHEMYKFGKFEILQI